MITSGTFFFENNEFGFLFNSNPLPMWIYDVETLRFLAVNDAAVAKYGYSHSEFLTMTLLDIRPKEDHQKIFNNISQNDDPYQWSGGWRHQLQNGELIDVEILSHEFEFDNRKSRLVTAHDVTPVRRAEAQTGRV